jgi:SAM-dependent methyltransferase
MAYWLLEWLEYSLLSSNGDLDFVYTENARLARSYPAYGTAFTRMAAIELLRNDHENSEAHAKQAVALNPHDVAALSIIAEIAFESDRHKEALNIHRAIIEIAGSITCESCILTNSLMEIADYFLSVGMVDTARNCYAKVLQENPNAPQVKAAFSDYSKNSAHAHAAISLKSLEKPEILSSYQKATVAAPLPPPYLFYYIMGHFNPNRFIDFGRSTVSYFREVLAAHHIDLGSFGKILDFGCGAGRLASQWKGFNGEVHGCDYNPALIRWCRKFFGSNFRPNPIVGRLTYPDEYFDFIYLLSVFTHLSADIQDFWYHELLRIIRPGGYLLITVHGDQFRDALNEQARTHYDAGNMAIVQAPFEGQNCCGAYHPKQYAYAKWDGNKTDIVCHVPGLTYPEFKQDMYLLRKKQ